MKRKPTRLDLLDRFTALGISGKKFESDNKLPRNLIAKMRQGDYSGEKAASTIERFEAAIEAVEKPRAPRSAPKKGAQAPPAAPAEVEKRPPGRPRAVTLLTDDEKKARGELRDAILRAADIAAVDECNKLVSGALIDGVISDTTARALRELLAERRQSLEDKAEDEERARAGQKITIEVRYVNAEWRKGEGA